MCDGGKTWTIGERIDTTPVADRFGYAGGELQSTGAVLTLGYQGAPSGVRGDNEIGFRVLKTAPRISFEMTVEEVEVEVR